MGRMEKVLSCLVIGMLLMSVVPVLSPAEGSNTVTYLELAEYWAPVWYQDTDSTDYDADYITNFDFDGNWIGTDNWENQPNFPLKAYIYYWVIETETHWFIGYADFHPRDWEEINVPGPSHENDMEGCLLMIKKDGSTYGQFLIMITVAHFDFYSYKDRDASPSKDVMDGYETIDVDVQFYRGHHPYVYVEAKGHGIYGDKRWENTDFPGGDGVVYYYTGTAEEPSNGNDRNVGYALKSIDELWERRFDYTNTFSSFGTFKSDTYGKNQANAPWGWDDHDDAFISRGEIFTDPAKLVDYYFNGLGDFSREYIYNPYMPTIPVPGSVSGSADLSKPWKGIIKVPSGLKELKVEIDSGDVCSKALTPIITDPSGNKYGFLYNSIPYSGPNQTQYFIFEKPQPGEWEIKISSLRNVDFTVTTKTEKSIKIAKRKVFMTDGWPSFVEISLPDGDIFDPGGVKRVKVSMGCTGLNCIKGHGAVTISVPKNNAHILVDDIDTYFWNAFVCLEANHEGVHSILAFEKAVELIAGIFTPTWLGLALTAAEGILDIIGWLQTRDYSYGSGPTGPEWTDIDKYEIYSFEYSTGSFYTGYACNRIEVTFPVELQGTQDIPIYVHSAYTWWDGSVTTKFVGHEETVTFKPKPDFHIDVVSKNYFYDTDETAKVVVDVTNNRDGDTEIWLGTTFKDPEGNEYDIPLKHAEILKGETKSFDMKWIIDKNRNKIVSTARQQLGKPYEWGAEGPDSFDCSGLIYYSYSQAGINIPRTTAEGYYNNYCDLFSNIESLIAGDLLFVYNTSTSKIEHVGILTANNTVIHASSYYGEVVEEPIKSFWNRFGRIKSQYWPEEKTILGRYEIAVNCWKDAGQTDKYTDDFEWEPIFYVYNLDIVSLTTSSPAIVGDPSNPAEFNAKVTGLGELGVCLLPTAFEVKIGGKPAKFQIYQIDLNGNYYFKITSPVQDTEGSYDLNISVNTGEISDYDLESNAVIYSIGGNIDVVEVIDRSGSMSGEKIQAAKDSAKLFVDLMTINDSIGVASYSSSASVNYGLTKITSETIKQNAKNAIDGISAGGSTSIGAGLRAAYNELVNKGDPSHPHSIVLMSDGWHNTAPHPDTVLPDIRNANIRVFTIGLGAGADASLLSHIAHDGGGGGGEYYYSPSSEELSAIYNAIAGVVKAESTVKTVTGSVQQGETITHKVDIDPTINIATFTVTWTSGTLDLGLERPDSSKVDPSDPDVLSHTKGATYETYTIDNPMVGEWTMKITAPNTSSSTKTATSDLINAAEGVITHEINNTMNDNWSTEIDVPARIKSAQKAIAQAGISYTATVTATTNLTVHMYTDKEKYSLNEPMKIITTLTKTGIPVIGANVNATIERPDTVKEYLSLYDDRKHEDGAALDGVYANYYTNTNVSGSYTITVHASGTASSEEFTREVKKSVYVSGVPAGEISVTPTSWDTGIVHPGEDAISAFTVSSTSTKNETVMVSATDLTDAHGNVIGSENVISMPSTFVVPAGGSGVFYERIYVPETAKTGNYTGSIVLTSTANSVNIPLTLQVKKLFETDIPNVELLYVDPTVTSINVTSLNLSEINETYKPEECITPQSTYMINSTGAGNFTLKFMDIPNANTIIVYKINATNQWIELNATTTADTVTFTMSVEDPPVVFCSGATPDAARVPALTPIGIIALVGLLAIAAVSRIRKKK